MKTKFALYNFWIFSFAILCKIVTSHAIPDPVRLYSSHANETDRFSKGRQFSVRLISKGENRKEETTRIDSVGDDDEIMENRSFFPRYSLLLQILIFICCAAGVSAVMILCCLILLHGLQFFSRSAVIVDNDGIVHMMAHSSSNGGRRNLNRFQIQRNRNNETILTFFPTHRHPWSPGVSHEENGDFSFPLNELQDLRIKQNLADFKNSPAYDELSASKEDEDSDQVSSPPPPYTPSFCETGTTKPQHTV